MALGSILKDYVTYDNNKKSKCNLPNVWKNYMQRILSYNSCTINTQALNVTIKN